MEKLPPGDAENEHMKKRTREREREMENRVEKKERQIYKSGRRR